MANSVSLATYSATYKIEGREYAETKLSVMSFPYTIDKKLVLQRMEKSDKEYPDEFVNIAYQILLKHKDAYDIKVTKQMDPLLTAMIVLLFLVFLFFGPIILAILMIGKPKKITPFRNVLNIEQYKKFRLIYLIIGFILYVGIIVLFILSIVIKSMSGMITPSLYILFGFDIVYLILSLIIGNSIYKKYHVEEPLPNGGEIISDPLTLESENEVTKAEEVSEEPSTSKTDELREYKKLLDDGIISKEDYEKKKNEIMFGSSKQKNKNGALVFFSWTAAILMALGMIIDLIVCFPMNSGHLLAIYKYIGGGYWGGFLMSGIGIIIAIPCFIVLYINHKIIKAPHIAMIVGFAIMAILMIVFAAGESPKESIIYLIA